MRRQGPQMTRHTPCSLAIRSEEAWGTWGQEEKGGIPRSGPLQEGPVWMGALEGTGFQEVGT